jgi:hypothetical protein
LGLDNTVPHARLQTVTRAPTENKRNKSIVEKNSSEKRVRINKPTAKKDNQPEANVPLFDDEWEREGKEQPPYKGDANNRQHGYFYTDGNVEWVVVKMIKRQTVTLAHAVIDSRGGIWTNSVVRRRARLTINQDNETNASISSSRYRLTYFNPNISNSRNSSTKTI